jgi:hypothetical protein
VIDKSEVFDFKAFIEHFDFGQNDLQMFVRYLCTQGNKEDMFSSILASKLDAYLFLHHPKLFVLTQYEDSSPMRKSKENPTEGRQVFQFTTGEGSGRFVDVAIVDSQDKVTDFIEFKTDRHSAYMNSFLDSNSQNISKVIDNKFWRDKTFSDVSKLRNKKIKSPNVRFWAATLLYSFYTANSDLPAKYPKYFSNEPTQARMKIAVPFTQKDLDDECAKKCEAFISALVSLKDKIPSHNKSHDGEDVKIELDRDDVIWKIVAQGSHRDVLVRSDLILFEVKLT